MGCIFTKDEDTSTTPTKKIYSWEVRDGSRIDVQQFRVEYEENKEIMRLPGSINGQQFLIQNCRNATIMLFDFINSVSIDDCDNTTIILGAVKGSVYLRNCSNVTCITCCGQFRARDCRKCVIFMHCATQPIIESSTSMKFGTNQLSYCKLTDHVASAGLNLSINFWTEVYDFTPVANETNWSFIETVEAKFRLKARTKRVEHIFKELGVSWLGQEPASIVLESTV